MLASMYKQVSGNSRLVSECLITNITGIRMLATM